MSTRDLRPNKLIDVLIAGSPYPLPAPLDPGRPRRRRHMAESPALRFGSDALVLATVLV